MKESHHHRKTIKHSKGLDKTIILIGLVAVLIIFNQIQIRSIANSIGGYGPTGSVISNRGFFSGGSDLKNVDVTEIQSTAQGVAVLFPIDEIKTADDAISVMIPTGTPDYGEAMGVSFDDPIASMESMARAYPALKKQAQEDPEVWQRYLSLAAAPRGVSCEFCCGIGAQGVTKDGNLRCGCKHNPAAQTITLWLMMNTDYTDAEVLKEVYNWKTLFFPKNMVGLAAQIAGGDISVLDDLPGMVGGC